ncbi:hypothetical protein GGX14DRAFT_666470 [Mycena pura]|uniref:Uncharacterized protein n=1 Tax=Mycena pura TaxID=153505 RepID=A0AAD6UZG7_9AGAR|nr:hypothetical protein GGX14DRAFT_666470 [Mycena pura]
MFGTTARVYARQQPANHRRRPQQRRREVARRRLEPAAEFVLHARARSASASASLSKVAPPIGHALNDERRRTLACAKLFTKPTFWNCATRLSKSAFVVSLVVRREHPELVPHGPRTGHGAAPARPNVSTSAHRRVPLEVIFRADRRFMISQLTRNRRRGRINKLRHCHSRTQREPSCLVEPGAKIQPTSAIGGGGHAPAVLTNRSIGVDALKAEASGHACGGKRHARYALVSRAAAFVAVAAPNCRRYVLHDAESARKEVGDPEAATHLVKEAQARRARYAMTQRAGNSARTRRACSALARMRVAEQHGEVERARVGEGNGGLMAGAGGSSCQCRRANHLACRVRGGACRGRAARRKKGFEGADSEEVKFEGGEGVFVGEFGDAAEAGDVENACGWCSV